MAVRDIPTNLSYDTFVEKYILRIFQNHAHTFESLHPCNLCFFVLICFLMAAACKAYLAGNVENVCQAARNTSLEQTPLNICQQVPAPYKRLTSQW